MEENESNETTKLKCIKEKCPYYHNSDDYFETCLLISKYVLLDSCYGISEIPNIKEIIVCKIAKLIEEIYYLNELEELIKDNQ